MPSWAESSGLRLAAMWAGAEMVGSHTTLAPRAAATATCVGVGPTHRRG